jgi:predicted DCC family thiol-disulfide oxidoreductase YuxK
VVVGLVVRRARPAAWSVLVLWHLAGFFAFGAAGGEASRMVLMLFAVEPGWWSGRALRAGKGMADTAPGSHPIPAHLFYDGDCGFCHRSVRFILSEELATPAPLRLRFAPLGSVSFTERLKHHPGLDAKCLPDSIVLELEDGAILTRSAAALEIASRLGGFWRFVSLLGSRLPSRLLDTGYDAIARVRKKLFAQPKDACPILPPDLRARFDA